MISLEISHYECSNKFYGVRWRFRTCSKRDSGEQSLRLEQKTIYVKVRFELHRANEILYNDRKKFDKFSLQILHDSFMETR